MYTILYVNSKMIIFEQNIGKNGLKKKELLERKIGKIKSKIGPCLLIGAVIS